MKLAAKAKQLKMKPDTLKRNAAKYGGVLVGTDYIFPDNIGEQVEDAADFVLPEISESEKILKWHQAMKMRGERIKVDTANAVSSGQFVDRNVLEQEWKNQALFVKKRVLGLPGLLKNRLADELSDRAEQVLEDLCREILDDLADGYSNR